MAIEWRKFCQRCCRRLETVSPKRIVVYISIFLLFSILFFLVLDAVSVFAVQNSEITTHSFSVVVLGIHCFALYLGLLGFTFFSLPLRKDRTMVYWSVAVVIFTLLLSVGRILLELETLGYRVEAYSSNF